mgnify:CR=1 FL=1
MSNANDEPPDALRSIHTRPLFVMRLKVRPLQIVGATPGALRRVGVVFGGTFEGERISGEVLEAEESNIPGTKESRNKELVLKAFETLFNRRDYAAAERFWSAEYIQDSAHIEPGRDGLFNLIKSSPPTLKYEPGVIVADGDFVIVHGRFSGLGRPANWIAADILRIKDGILVEHWDVLQDEATKGQSKSGNPMFGDTFPEAQVSTGRQ